MRIASFRHQERDSFGMVTPAGIVDFGAPGMEDLRAALAVQAPGTLQALARAAGPVRDARDVTWLPPIPAPEKILCVGYNYRAHLIETNTPIPKHPAFFVRFPGAQVGHEAPIVKPSASDSFDFEGELAVIIGRGGRHIRQEDALAHVAGYACFAENSVRDFQRHSTQATPGKNFDSSGAFGPFMVTADEIPDPRALHLTTRLNGQVMQQSGVDDLIFSVEYLIAYASSFTRLVPGDVIATGTPAGVGMSRTPPVWLRPGDELEVEISGIGVLRNTVTEELLTDAA